MEVKSFKELIAWQKAQDLAVDIYSSFGSLKSHGFKDQICKAAVSISNNIAQGFDRGDHNEFSRFLYSALGSCSQTKSMLFLAERLYFLEKKDMEVLIEKAREISKIIRGIIKSLSSQQS